MKKDNEPGAVLVGRDTRHLSRTHSGALDPFTTVRIEKGKRDAAVAYRTFWYTVLKIPLRKLSLSSAVD
jgi:hypothetical protein